jgi:hypothetical protein
MAKKSVGVLGDLTALFAARSFLKKNINYSRLNDSLKEYLNIPTFGMAKFFTLYHPNNKKQLEFLTFLKEQLEWEVETTVPQEIRTTNDYRNYRFDVPIAYHLGSESVADEFDRLVIISDSVELIKPMQETAHYVPGGVFLAFYNNALDGRWWKVLTKENSGIKFIDLDEIGFSKDNQEYDNSDRYEG